MLKYIPIILGFISATILIFVPQESGKLRSTLIIVVIAVFVLMAIFESIKQYKSEKEQKRDQEKILQAIENITGAKRSQITDSFGRELEDGKIYSVEGDKGVKSYYVLTGDMLYVKTQYPDLATGTFLQRVSGEVVDINLPYPITEYKIEIDEGLVVSQKETELKDGQILHELQLTQRGQLSFTTLNGKLTSTPTKTGQHVNSKVLNTQKTFLFTPQQ